MKLKIYSIILSSILSGQTLLATTPNSSSQQNSQPTTNTSHPSSTATPPAITSPSPSKSPRLNLVMFLDKQTTDNVQKLSELETQIEEHKTLNSNLKDSINKLKLELSSPSVLSQGNPSKTKELKIELEKKQRELDSYKLGSKRNEIESLLKSKTQLELANKNLEKEKTNLKNLELGFQKRLITLTSEHQFSPLPMPSDKDHKPDRTFDYAETLKDFLNSNARQNANEIQTLQNELDSREKLRTTGEELTRNHRSQLKEIERQISEQNKTVRKLLGSKTITSSPKAKQELEQSNKKLADLEKTRENLISLHQTHLDQLMSQVSEAKSKNAKTKKDLLRTISELNQKNKRINLQVSELENKKQYLVDRMTQLGVQLPQTQQKSQPLSSENRDKPSPGLNQPRTSVDLHDNHTTDSEDTLQGDLPISLDLNSNRKRERSRMINELKASMTAPEKDGSDVTLADRIVDKICAGVKQTQKEVDLNDESDQEELEILTEMSGINAVSELNSLSKNPRSSTANLKRLDLERRIGEFVERKLTELETRSQTRNERWRTHRALRISRSYLDFRERCDFDQSPPDCSLFESCLRQFFQTNNIEWPKSLRKEKQTRKLTGENTPNSQNAIADRTVKRITTNHSNSNPKTRVPGLNGSIGKTAK